MKVIYLRSVVKDVKKIKDPKLKDKILSVIKEMKEASKLEELRSLKKLSGHPTAYRIRIGDYRLGFYFEDGTIMLARFLKRSDIFKVFP